MSEFYEYVRASVLDGQLSYRSKLAGCGEAQDRHDEDVSDYTRAQLDRLLRDLLDIDAHDPVKVSWI